MGVETLRSTPQRLLGAESREGGRKKSRGGGAEQERGGAPRGQSAPEGHTHTDGCRGRRLEETQARSAPGSERPPALGPSPQPGLGWAARQPPLSLCAPQQKGQKLRSAGGRLRWRRLPGALPTQAVDAGLLHNRPKNNPGGGQCRGEGRPASWDPSGYAGPWGRAGRSCFCLGPGAWGLALSGGPGGTSGHFHPQHPGDQTAES